MERREGEEGKKCDKEWREEEAVDDKASERERVQGVEVQSALQRHTETANSQELFDNLEVQKP